MIRTPDGRWMIEVHGKTFVADCLHCRESQKKRVYFSTESLSEMHRMIEAHEADSHKK